jgi:hypothetical protein
MLLARSLYSQYFLTIHLMPRRRLFNQHLIGALSLFLYPQKAHKSKHTCLLSKLDFRPNIQIYFQVLPIKPSPAPSAERKRREEKIVEISFLYIYIANGGNLQSKFPGMRFCAKKREIFLRAGFEPATYGWLPSALLQSTALPTELSKAHENADFLHRSSQTKVIFLNNSHSTDKTMQKKHAIDVIIFFTVLQLASRSLEENVQNLPFFPYLR